MRIGRWWGKQYLKPENPSFNSRAEDIEARRGNLKGITEMESFCKKRNWGIVEINNFEFFFLYYRRSKIVWRWWGGSSHGKAEVGRYREFSWVLVTCNSPPVRESRQICTLTLTRSCLFDIDLGNRIQGMERRQVKALAKVLSFETDSEIQTRRRCRSLG